MDPQYSVALFHPDQDSRMCPTQVNAGFALLRGIVADPEEAIVPDEAGVAGVGAVG
jgi:hypothetical protein